MGMFLGVEDVLWTLRWFPKLCWVGLGGFSDLWLVLGMLFGFEDVLWGCLFGLRTCCGLCGGFRSFVGLVWDDFLSGLFWGCFLGLRTCCGDVFLV